MRTEQLHQIIKDKNEQHERQALRTAESIIEGIVKEQQSITKAQSRIAELRAELVTLQAEQFDPKSVLGEE